MRAGCLPDVMAGALSSRVVKCERDGSIYSVSSGAKVQIARTAVVRLSTHGQRTNFSKQIVVPLPPSFHKKNCCTLPFTVNLKKV